jgi:outer membrane protein OmpA-like peptidoglycan-associated protein/flagellar hook assembly protein FlgD
MISLHVTTGVLKAVKSTKTKGGSMKNRFWGLVITAVALSVALLGCQTVKPVTAENSIQTEQTGLAPNGDAQHSTIDFSLVFGNKDAIKSWKVEIGTGSGPQKQWSGDGKDLRTALTWDGRSETGVRAPEGTYRAKLTVDYGTGGAAMTAQSGAFILDISPPTGSVTFNPGRFTPDANGVSQPVTISIKGSSAVARMDSWSLDILDQDGKAFRSFDGKWSSTEVQWDGKSLGGDWVVPARSYSAEVTLRDEFGNSSLVSSTIAVSDLARAPQPALLAATPGTLGVIAGSGGFSPNGDTVMDSMTFALFYGQSKSVNSWKLEILNSGQHVQKTFSGDGSTLPLKVSWDGKNDSAILQAEGTYTARLSVDYGGLFKPGSTTSTTFVLALTPPSGSITLSEPLFSPIESSATITLNVNATSRLAQIDSWRMEIYDPEYHLFRAFEFTWPTKSAVWEGKDFNGAFVQSAEDYPVLVKVRDEFGNVGVLKAVVPVDILVERTATGFRILSSRIFFQAYTADYQDVKPELAAQNMKRLDDLTAKLQKFPDYRIRLVGHAVMIYWDNKSLGDVEQRDVLIPLSKARAEAVMKALVDRGLSSSMFTRDGVGASDQLVPDSNLADRWRNRRVAFFLER